MEKIMPEEYFLKEGEKIEFIEIDNSYRFFDGAIGFIAGVCATKIVREVQSSGKGRPFKDNDYVFFAGTHCATNKNYFVYPNDIYKHLINNDWSKSLKIIFRENTTPNEARPKAEFTSFNKISLALGQAMYIQFWESIKVEIENTFGKIKDKRWPEIFVFGWIIRNTFAHNNFRLEINDSSIENVRWAGLTYGYSKCGSYSSKDIMFFELILLMRDIENEFRKTIK
jgi:hypothetical protein